MANISGTELIVGAIATSVTAAGGGVVAWFAKQVVGMRDDLRGIKQKLYGDEHETNKTGLVADVHSIRATVEDIDHRVEDVEGRVSHIERVCSVQHGETIFRDAPQGA